MIGDPFALYAVQVLAVFIGLSAVQAGSSAGALNGGLSRSFFGSATTFTASTALSGWSGVESFIRASADGKLGLSGYAFVASLAFLVGVWVINLYERRQVIA